MDKAEQSQKLRDITKLRPEELRGWWRYVCIRGSRHEFDGERSALLSRAKYLGIDLNEVPT